MCRNQCVDKTEKCGERISEAQVKNCSKALASTNTGRADDVTTRTVKHYSWLLKTSVFKLILRMHASSVFLVSACILIDIMDLIPSIKLLACKTGRRLSQLEGRVAGNGCSLRIKFPHQETRRWHEEEVGRFVRRIGNLWPAFSCIPRITTIREMEYKIITTIHCP